MPGNGSDDYQWTTLGRRLYEDDVAERQRSARPPVLLGRRRAGGPRRRRGHRLRRGRARLEQHHADAPRSHRSRAAREAAVDDRRLPRGGRLRAMRRCVLRGCCSSRARARASKPPPAATGSGVAAIAQRDDAATACSRAVEQLYRAEAQAKEPKRVDEAVADNTHDGDERLREGSGQDRAVPREGRRRSPSSRSDCLFPSTTRARGREAAQVTARLVIVLARDAASKPATPPHDAAAAGSRAGRHGHAHASSRSGATPRATSLGQASRRVRGRRREGAARRRQDQAEVRRTRRRPSSS